MAPRLSIYAPWLDPAHPNFPMAVQQYFANHADPYAGQYPSVQAAIEAGFGTHKELQQFLRSNPRASGHYSNLVSGGAAPMEALDTIRNFSAFEPKDILDRDLFWKAATDKTKKFDPEGFTAHLQMRGDLIGSRLGDDEVEGFVNPETGTIDMEEYRKWRAFQSRENPTKSLRERGGHDADVVISSLNNLGIASSDPDEIHKSFTATKTNPAGTTLGDEWEGSDKHVDPKNPSAPAAKKAFIDELAKKDATRLQATVKAQTNRLRGLGASDTELRRHVQDAGFDPDAFGLKASSFAPKYAKKPGEPMVPPALPVDVKSAAVPTVPKDEPHPLLSIVPKTEADAKRNTEEIDRVWTSAKTDLQDLLAKPIAGKKFSESDLDTIAKKIITGETFSTGRQVPAQPMGMGGGGQMVDEFKEPTDYVLDILKFKPDTVVVDQAGQKATNRVLLTEWAKDRDRERKLTGAAPSATPGLPPGVKVIKIK